MSENLLTNVSYHQLRQELQCLFWARLDPARQHFHFFKLFIFGAILPKIYILLSLFIQMLSSKIQNRARQCFGMNYIDQMHFSAFFCIYLHFSTFLYIFPCISLHFSIFLFISLHLSAFLCISVCILYFIFQDNFTERTVVQG